MEVYECILRTIVVENRLDCIDSFSRFLCAVLQVFRKHNWHGRRDIMFDTVRDAGGSGYFYEKGSEKSFYGRGNAEMGLSLWKNNGMDAVRNDDRRRSGRRRRDFY